jgi:hypothetical protein
VDKSSSHAVGTNDTARIRHACVLFAAGKRPSVRRNGVPTKQSKSSTPRPNVRAARAPSLCHNPRKSLKLRWRVVTQQKFFLHCRCATGRGAMNRAALRGITRQPTAVPPAVRRSSGCWIVNASGGSVARSRAAKRARGNTRPPAPAAAANYRTSTGRRHPSHRRRNRDPWPRRSAVAGLAPHTS